MPEIVACGETMVLLAPATSGPLRYVQQFTKHIGGAESNVLIGAVRLGHTAGWISRVGDDEFGRYVLSQIRGEGVDVSRVRVDPQAPTGVYFKERREAGESRVYYYRRGSAASRLSPGDLDRDYVAQARVVLISGITPALSESARETAFAAAALARAAGSIVAFDPNVRLKLWRTEEAVPVLRDLAAQADVVLPGADEAALLTGEGDPERAAAALLALQGPGGRSPRTVVVKLGAAGALVATRTPQGVACRRAPGFPVARVVDPIGAGDGFAAGFLCGLLEGLDDVEAARLGNAVGALATTVVGDIEGLPTQSEVAAFMGARPAEADR